ncbi:septum formation protein [Nitriliruptoraceae bacterium ZYF776]|nr:septum formation protein [Profundirhabdus halotolerans]
MAAGCRPGHPASTCSPTEDPHLRARTLAGGLAAAALLLAGCGQGNVFDLSVGDCFNTPEDLAEVSDVEIVECSEPHDVEVFATVELADDEDGEYPGTQAVFRDSEERCIEQFEAYVGRDYATSRLAVGTFVPSSDTWRAGDRDATCFLGDAGQQPLTGSMQGSGE